MFGLFDKKEDKLQAVQQVNSNEQGSNSIEPEAKKDKDPWQFLKDIAKKIFGFKKQVQQDILDCGRRLKSQGVSFVLMVDTSPELPKSPAKEKAKKEKSGQGLKQ